MNGWMVVAYHGDHINDYTEAYYHDKDDAIDWLTRLHYGYSTTYGTEDVYHDAFGNIASIAPMEA